MARKRRKKGEMTDSSRARFGKEPIAADLFSAAILARKAALASQKSAPYLRLALAAAAGSAHLPAALPSALPSALPAVLPSALQVAGLGGIAALPVAGLAGIAAASAALPEIKKRLAAAAPALVTRAVNAAVEATAPKYVPLYTEDVSDDEPDFCASLNAEEPSVMPTDESTYAQPDDTVGKIRDTLELVVKVTAFDAHACTLDTLARRVEQIAEHVRAVDLWANAELVMSLAVAFEGEVAWVPAETVEKVRSALLALVESGAQAALPAPVSPVAPRGGLWGAASALSSGLSSIASGAASLLGWQTELPALVLRQCEVAMRALGARESAAFVAHVRARTWADWLSGRLKLDELRFFGYEFLELPGGYRHKLADQREPEANWAVDLAYSAATSLYPAVHAQAARITELAMSTAPRLRYRGYERAGTGFALLKATETRALLQKYDARYARAHGAVMRYAAALLEQPPEAAQLVSVKWSQEPSVSPPPQPVTQPKRKVSKACATARGDPRLRRGMNYNRTCANSEREGTRRGYAVASLNSATSIDQLFALIDHVELFPPKALAEFTNKVAAAPSENAAQMRRLEVLCTRLGLKAQSAGRALYAHVESNALLGKPHGLAVHELGCEHTVVKLGHATVRRTLFTPGPLDPGWLRRAGSWLASTLAPGATELASALLAETRATAQYKGLESPGTGYALVQLLAVLDDVSARVVADEGYAFVRSATLAAVKQLLC
jgi:hypothetical protein